MPDNSFVKYMNHNPFDVILNNSLCIIQPDCVSPSGLLSCMALASNEGIIIVLIIIIIIENNNKKKGCDKIKTLETINRGMYQLQWYSSIGIQNWHLALLYQIFQNQNIFCNSLQSIEIRKLTKNCGSKYFKLRKSGDRWIEVRKSTPWRPFNIILHMITLHQKL